MMESNTLADNVTMKQQQREILRNTHAQYMKELNTLAVNVSIKLHKRDILLNTNGRYMNESSTFAVIFYWGKSPKTQKKIIVNVQIVHLDKMFVNRIDKNK